MSSEVPETTRGGISRRTVAAGVAWATPAIAVGAATPVFAASGPTTTLAPCIESIVPSGGTYPVQPSLWGCSVTGNLNTHWDFRFKIKVSAEDCGWACVRIRVYDNVRTGTAVGGRSSWVYDPTSYHNNARNQFYVEEIVSVGSTASFGFQGDQVRDSVTNAVITTLTADGTSNDALHVLWNPGQAAESGTPCGRTGPMGYYTVEYSKTCTNPVWENKTDQIPLSPCIPMIKTDSACVTGSGNNTKYTLGLSVLTSCGIPASGFTVTKVQRNNNASDPTAGTAIWTGGQTLGSGTTTITTNPSGSQGNGQNYLWVWFHTGDAANISRIRFEVPTNTCPGGCTSAPAIPTGRSACRVSGTSGSSSKFRYTWTAVTGTNAATSYNVRYSTNTSSNNPGWTTVTGVTSGWQTTTNGVQRLQVQAVNDCGEGAWSDSTTVSSGTGLCGPSFASDSSAEAPASVAPAAEAPATEATTSTEAAPEAPTSEAATSE